jgi:hypothetical protein
MRDSDWRHLHPAFRVHVEELATVAAPLGLRPYEGGRTPTRQVELYARGRTIGERGKTVTRAKAWESFHQYGFAEDFVFFVDGKWTWVEPEKGAWAEFQRLARGAGLRTLSFEIPHVELPISLADLQAGRYPMGGDAFWEEWIETQIEAWGHEPQDFAGIIHPAAPPMPTFEQRPPESHWDGLPPSPFA